MYSPRFELEYQITCMSYRIIGNVLPYPSYRPSLTLLSSSHDLETWHFESGESVEFLSIMASAGDSIHVNGSASAPQSQPYVSNFIHGLYGGSCTRIIERQS
jgi:hypothetical protein